MKKSPSRGLAIGFVVAVLSLGNYTRIPESEGVRAIHVVTLITCGIGVGVALVCLIVLLRSGNNNP